MEIKLAMSEREARALATWLDEGGSLDGDLAEVVAHQIENQLPRPRIPEPSLWAIVEAGVKQHDTRLKWIRLEGGEWAPDDDGEYARYWEELIDPVLIREGI